MRRLHISWLISGLDTGFIIGAAIAPLYQGSRFIRTIPMVVALLALAVALINRRVYILVLVAISGITLGIYRADIELREFAQYRPYYGRWTKLEGKVSEDTTLTSSGQQRIKLINTTIGGQSLAGEVWVEAKSNTEIKRSDKITVEGLLSEGFGSFVASMHRAELKSVSKIKHGDVAREVRDWFADGVKRNVEEPEASLGIGYLTGQRNSLPEELDSNLRVLGLTHIVVASGFNLTILVRFTRRLFARVSKYLATITGFGMMISFILITGFSPSMSRAGIVTGLSLLAWYFGRRIHPFVLLPLAAAITIYINPSFIWGDVGWYLSFAAFAGVIILAPLLRHYFFGEKGPGTIKQILIETVSAQIVTLPIIAFIFGQYGPLAVPANLLILPLVPLAMVFTFMAGVASIGGLPLVGLWALPAQTVLDYMTAVIDKLASLPFSEGELNIGPKTVLFGYVGIILLALFLWRKTRHNFGQDSIIE